MYTHASSLQQPNSIKTYFEHVTHIGSSQQSTHTATGQYNTSQMGQSDQLGLTQWQPNYCPSPVSFGKRGFGKCPTTACFFSVARARISRLDNLTCTSYLAIRLERSFASKSAQPTADQLAL